MVVVDNRYCIDDTSSIISPALIVFVDLVEQNIKQMISVARDVGRLRPHCKTHKMREVAEIGMRLGITKHKAATFAEAEMLVAAGVKDVFLAYNLVGPNIGRAVAFRQKYPDVTFSVTADHPLPIQQLSAAMSAAGETIEVLLDVDTGMQRTGVTVGPQALELYGQLAASQGLLPGGLHVYDGHNHQQSTDDRRAAVDASWVPVLEFRDQLRTQDWPVPRIVAGGTGSFPMYAEKEEPTLELSPGTIVFHDVGYRDAFPDLKFTPATLLLTRVISCPTPTRITLDLGYKAVSGDQPEGRRLELPDLPDARQVLQNEEHLCVETERAGDFQPGDELLAIPRHICPTTALHRQVVVVTGGKVTDRWDVVARDRQLTI